MKLFFTRFRCLLGGDGMGEDDEDEIEDEFDEEEDIEEPEKNSVCYVIF